MTRARLRVRNVLLALFVSLAAYTLRPGCGNTPVTTNLVSNVVNFVSDPEGVGTSSVVPADKSGSSAGSSYFYTCSNSADTTVSITAAPTDDPRYRFDHWDGDCNGTNPTAQVVFTKGSCKVAKTCTAVFVFAAFDLSARPSTDMAKMSATCDGPCPPVVPLHSHTSGVGSKTLRAVAYDAYLAVGDSGALTTSSDGLTWTAGSFGASYNNTYFIGVAASATATNHYVAVGGDGFATATGTCLYSTDAVTWTACAAAASSTAPASALDVVWGNNQYVTGGKSGEYCTSPDGATWTCGTQGGALATAIVARIIWTGAQYVAVGAAGSGGPLVATSTNGTSWTSQAGAASATTQGLGAVGFNGSLLVAVGGGGSVGTNADIITSPDGVTWTKATFSGGASAASLNSVAWTGTWWAAFGFGGASLISSDGATWLDGNHISNISYDAAIGAVGPRGLVAVGDTGTITTAEK